MFHKNPNEAGAASGSIYPCRILHLDDSLFDRKRLRRICADLDLLIQLDEAETVQEFKAQLGGTPYDLYILDCRLPVDSGFTALEILQDRGLGNASDVVMTSAMDIREFASAARLGGCYHFIEKSDLSGPTMRRVLEKTVNSASHSDHATKPATRLPDMHHVPVVHGHFKSRQGSFAMGADGKVLHLNAQDRVVSIGDTQSLIDLAMQMLDADEFIFDT